MSTSQSVKDAFALSLFNGEGRGGRRARRNSFDMGIDGAQLDELVKKVKLWIDDCVNNHLECRSQESNILPSRLLDVGPPDGSENPSLWVTSTTNLSDCETTKTWKFWSGSQTPLRRDISPLYVALSYCWGKAPFLTTTHKTLKQRQNVIPMISLPRTIREAVWFTRFLGLRYLWVDSLCILQGPGSEAAEDWARESANMDRIYGGAVVTVCASMSSDANKGIIPVGGRMFLPHGYQPHIVEEPLNRRAWALQERILSPRVVAFCTSQMVWECDHGHDFEDSNMYFTDRFGDGLPFSSKYAKRLSVSPLPDEWYAIVEDYTSRQLTYASDRLPALAGIAKLYSKRTSEKSTAAISKIYPKRASSKYLAGLWEDDILNGILWKHLSMPGQVVETLQHRAPSWSWASVDGPVEFVRAAAGEKDNHQKLARFVSVEAIQDLPLLRNTPTSRLVLKGFLIKVVVSLSVIPPRSVSKPRVQFDHPLEQPSSASPNTAYITDDLGKSLGTAALDASVAAKLTRPTIASLEGPASSSRSMKAFCLPLTSMHGLLLQPSGDKTDEFRRIGLFSKPLDRSAKWKLSWQKIAITIV